MYKLKKEYSKQKVVCFFPDGSSVNLDTATQKEFEKVYKIKAYQKFIEKSADKKDKK